MQANEIQSALEKSVEYYKKSLLEYSPEQFVTKPNDEEWSIGQMYEHVCMSALYFFYKRVTYCLEQRKGQIGGDKNIYGEKQFKYNSFPPAKLKIPDALKGPEPVAQEQHKYLDLLDQIIAEGKILAERIPLDTGEYKCLQPAFGWLDAHEWFWLNEQHFRHHLLQKARIDTFLDIAKN
ncbi:DinB family protein [Cellulophaga sp. BC115SP]|uniref:DinB family protein n=1 Tax=Cellulophaga sp. BC115SP TaxID=2683263 RepID=UPI0014133999|nr:DinB family protein [Cellulophaga sp. BC115SP]NBB27240.1 DinB family protein [Cellulophaga sp. BC115SP]